MDKLLQPQAEHARVTTGRRSGTGDRTGGGQDAVAVLPRWPQRVSRTVTETGRSLSLSRRAREPPGQAAMPEAGSPSMKAESVFPQNPAPEGHLDEEAAKRAGRWGGFSLRRGRGGARRAFASVPAPASAGPARPSAGQSVKAVPGWHGRPLR